MHCKLLIEISSKAVELQKNLGIEWGFSKNTPLDAFSHLRACISKPLVLPSKAIAPIPTGIYAQITSPNFIIEVTSFTDLVFNKGIALADGVSKFDYTFRNEIWVLLENKFDQAQTIYPAEKVAIFSIKQAPQTVIEYVTQIEESPWKLGSQKYIQTLKSHKTTKEKLSEGYSRSDIETIRKLNEN